MSDENLNFNNQLILISGFSAAGKSASLENIRDQEKWLYLNTEAGKLLPFRNKFNTHVITDPYQVHEALHYAIAENQEAKEKGGELPIKGIIVDSLTFLMDMYETQYIYKAADGRTAWADFQQYFKTMMQQLVPQFGMPVIFTAHVKLETDENTGNTYIGVPIKGALKNTGVESYFSTVVGAKRVSLKELADYKNDMLVIDEDEEILGFKYVFQTRLTKKTVNEKIRSPKGFFGIQETFINNDVQMLLDHLNKQYSM